VVKESLSKLSRRGGFNWQEIDVDADVELRRQFNDEVPVVFIDGRKAFKYRMDEKEFLRKLAS
jgi:glutaredoxin